MSNKINHKERIIKENYDFENEENFNEELAFTQQSIINNRCRHNNLDEYECFGNDYYQNNSNDNDCFNTKHHHHHNHCNNHNKKRECCCKKSMQEALWSVLNSLNRVQGLVEFDKFAFFGKHFTVGAEYDPHVCDCINNIKHLRGTLKSFESCNPSILNISGHLNSASSGYICDDEVCVSKVSICDLDAIAFSINVEVLNHIVVQSGGNCITPTLMNLLKCVFDDISYDCCNIEEDECCCNNAVLKSIYSPCSFSVQNIGLTAGNLVLKSVQLLGVIGNVLVLYSPPKHKMHLLEPSDESLLLPSHPTKPHHKDGIIYLVCLDSVGFIV